MIVQTTDSIGSPILIDTETGQEVTGSLPETPPEVVPEPIVPTPEPSPEVTDVQTPEEKREAELKQALDDGAKINSGEAQLPPDVDPDQYQKSLIDVQAKYNLLKQAQAAEKSYVDAGITIPEDVKQNIDAAKNIVVSPVSPFINLSPDNNYSIDVVNALKAGTDISELQKVGVSDDQIVEARDYIGKEKDYRESLSMRDLMKGTTESKAYALPVGGHEIDVALDDYQQGNGYDVARFLRENPNSADYLLSKGFRKEDINQAKTYNALPYISLTAQDRLYKKAYEIGLDLTGKQSPEEVARILQEHPEILLIQAMDEKQVGLKTDISQSQFVNNFVQARKDLPEYKTLGDESEAVLKNMAVREYIRLYGKGTLLASQGTDILQVVVPAARALHPEVTIKDITAKEWAESAANIILMVVAPVLGKVATLPVKGIQVVGGIGKTLEVGAAVTYPTLTALEWKDMSVGKRIFNVVIDATITGAILGKPIVNSMKHLVTGVGFSSRVEGVANAVISRDATAIWKAGDRLESYGESLARTGIKEGNRIIEYARYIKNNANGLTKVSQSVVTPEFQSLIDDLRVIDNSFAAARQRGVLQIDSKTGKIIDSETGLEMTPERQLEKVRQDIQKRYSTITSNISRKMYDDAVARGLSDAEIAEIAERAGGNDKLFWQLVDQKLKNKQYIDELLKSVEDSANKADIEERFGKAEYTDEGLDPVRDARLKEAQESYLDDLERAARKANQERVYQTLFPNLGTEIGLGIAPSVVGAPTSTEPAWIEGEEFGKVIKISVPVITPLTPLPIQIPAEQDLTKLTPEQQQEQIRKQQEQQAVKELQRVQEQQRQWQEEQRKQQEQQKQETKVAPETKTETQTKPATETVTETGTKTETVTETRTAEETEVSQGVQTTPRIGIPAFVPPEIGDYGRPKKDKVPPRIPIPEFEEDEAKNEKLKWGFITWRQGKTHWAIPQLEDGSFNSDDKVASGKPFIGTTKYAVGKRSVYNTIEYVGKHPPDKAFVDLGWAQYNVQNTPDGIKLVKVHPDETANWEGVNKYTTPEALAEKKLEEQRQREIKRLADIERYRRQYLKPRNRQKFKEDIFKESDKLLKRTAEEPQVITSGKRTYLGYEILPSQIGGEL
jgi:hypothetical protein